MPSAKGLFHKAVVLSGASVRSGDKEVLREARASYVLKEAGLKPAEIDKLQAMPWKEYFAIATKAQQKLTAEMAAAGVTRPARAASARVVDGKILPQHPYSPDAAPTAADVPMIICSTLNEQSPSWQDSSLENITLTRWPRR